MRDPGLTGNSLVASFVSPARGVAPERIGADLRHSAAWDTVERIHRCLFGCRCLPPH
jgi:hypothetical protein